MISLPGLARFAVPAPAGVRSPRCEVCGGPLGEVHRHVLELGERGVQCACQACGILFARTDSLARFRTVPDRVLVESALRISPARWAELGIPVAIAFCYRDSIRDRGIVCYPGPAGTTEADLEETVWDELRGATALVDELADDVEALLVRGGRGATSLACYLVPISSAFELAGRLRQCWQGFSGGEEAERELTAFFAELDHKGGRR